MRHYISKKSMPLLSQPDSQLITLGCRSKSPLKGVPDSKVKYQILFSPGTASKLDIFYDPGIIREWGIIINQPGFSKWDSKI